MTLYHAIEQLQNGKATKRPNMRGYIYFKDNTVAAKVEDETDTTEVVELPPSYVLVDKDGNETEFKKDETIGECKLDHKLFSSMCSDDWEISDKNSLEESRVGDSNW